MQHECFIKKKSGGQGVSFQKVGWVNLNFPLAHQNVSNFHVCRKFHTVLCNFETAKEKLLLYWNKYEKHFVLVKNDHAQLSCKVAFYFFI